MIDRFLIPFTVLTTLLGVFTHLQALPYRVRLWAVGIAAVIASVRAIDAITKRKRRSEPKSPPPSPRPILLRAVLVALAAGFTTFALVFVDRYHTIRVVHVSDGLPSGASEVRLSAPLASSSLQLDCSVGPAAFLVAAPVPSGPASSQPRVTVGQLASSSAQFFVDDFESPQHVTFQVQVSPSHTAVIVEVATTTGGINVLYADDSSRHQTIAYSIGGLLCVGGWLLLWSRWWRAQAA